KETSWYYSPYPTRRSSDLAAIFSYFRGVQLREGDDAGNITIDRFEHGWYWLIPLRDGVMSVGAVCFPDYLKQRRGDNEAFLMQRSEEHTSELQSRENLVCR